MSEFIKEQFRGVVWPREPGDTVDVDGKPVFPYVIVGMLVTDTPIEGLHHNETVIDGAMTRYAKEMGIAGAIERAAKFHAAYRLGDAIGVLSNLDNIVGEPLTKPAAQKKRRKSTMDQN